MGFKKIEDRQNIIDDMLKKKGLDKHVNKIVSCSNKIKVKEFEPIERYGNKLK